MYTTMIQGELKSKKLYQMSQDMISQIYINLFVYIILSSIIGNSYNNMSLINYCLDISKSMKYHTDVIRKSHKNLHRALGSKRKPTMKKTIAILVILLLTSFSLFSTGVDNTKRPSTINVTAEIDPIVVFGVISPGGVSNHDFQTIARFKSAISSSLEIDVVMVDLYNGFQIAFLAGINNTNSPVTIDITITDLVSGDNAVALTVTPTQAIIPAAANNAFGILNNARINIKEAVRGRSRLAPAGDYKATITFALTT